MATNDSYLFEEIKSGNKPAFDKLFRMYYQDLCRFAMFNSCSPEDAEEIVQDLFFKIWQNKNSISLTSSIKSYLFSATKNSVINKFKHEKVKSKYVESHHDDNYELDSSELMEQQQSADKIQAVINKLPEKRRQVFTMSKIDGYKYKEIAKKLDISIKTVENQMGEALKFLRENLSGYELVIILAISSILIKSDYIIGVFRNLIVLT